jgi:hypothetical protein
MKKIAADLIATEMYRLLKKASDEDSAVSVNVAGNAKVDKAEDKKADMSDDSDDADYSDDADDSDDLDDVHGYFEDHVEEDGDDDNFIMDEIDAMMDHAKADPEDHSEDSLMRRLNGSHAMSEGDDGHGLGMSVKASDARLMQGLGRIEASLRNKGEAFAADLVRTTALSIQDDIVKEASQRAYVLRNLVKMASSLENRGDRSAAKMVRSTIMKINR